jgi:hypothetical protein
MENYEIWDHHGERCIEAGNMKGTNPPEVREDDDAHQCMMIQEMTLQVVVVAKAMVVEKAVVGRMMVKTTKKKKTSWTAYCATQNKNYY